MTKREFRALLETTVRRAISQEGIVLDADLAKDANFELHGVGHSGALVNIDEVIDKIFIDESTFFRIIDVGVKSIARVALRCS